jgi:hypothetical protein
MARAIIVSHGGRTIGKDETFVPAGKSLSL